MKVIEVSILDPKASKILNNLAELDLIRLSKPYKLSSEQKKSIAVGRRHIKQGKVKNHKEVMHSLDQWLRGK